MLRLDFTDITANLPSVQFESALTEEQAQENSIRNKSHCLLFVSCAQALYFVSSLNEFRENRQRVLHPNDKKLSNKLLKDLEAKEPLLVGIIGYGRLGSRLAHFLVRASGLQPQEIKISTRRPETAADLCRQGSQCKFDNARVASSVHVLFLCCPPAALRQVAQEIRHNLSPRTIVYSFVTGFKEKKLRQLLEHESVICPRCEFNMELSDTWQLKAEMHELLGRPAACAAACPLPRPEQSATDGFVRADSKLATLWVYALANVCSWQGHSLEETMRILNHICVRSAIHRKRNEADDQQKQEEEEKDEEGQARPQILARDLIRGLEEDDERLPLFDLSDIELQDTYLDQRLHTDSALADAMAERFMNRLSTAYTKFKFHDA